MKSQADYAVGRVLGQLSHAPNVLETSLRELSQKKDKMLLRDSIKRKTEKLNFKRRISCTKSKETYYSDGTVSKERTKENKGKKHRKVAGNPLNIMKQLAREKGWMMGTPKKPQRRSSPLKLPQRDKQNWALLSRLKPDLKKSSEPGRETMYVVHGKCFYSDKLKFSTLLRKIYYEGYRTKDIESLLYSCLQKPFSTKIFFEIIEQEARTFAESVRVEILRLINKVSLKIDVNLFAEEEEDSVIDYFVPLSEATRSYKKIFGLVFDYYELLNSVHEEIKNIIVFYLKNFSSKQYDLTADDFYFHKSVLIRTVHEDKNINYFLHFHYSWLYHSPFYTKAFNRILNKLTQFMNEFGYGIFYDEDGDELDYPMPEPKPKPVQPAEPETEVQGKSETKSKKRKKKKKNKKKQSKVIKAKTEQQNDKMLQIFDSKLQQRDEELLKEKVYTRRAIVLDEQDRSMFEEIIEANRY